MHENYRTDDYIVYDILSSRWVALSDIFNSWLIFIETIVYMHHICYVQYVWASIIRINPSLHPYV